MNQVTHEKVCAPCKGTGEQTIKNGGYDVEIPCEACMGYGTLCVSHGDPLCEECF